MEIFGNIVDVVRGVVFPGKVVIEGGLVTKVIPVDSLVSDRYIMPGFIDAHVHIESSMLVPSSFARIAVSHGTVATVSDPHEIANVLGEKGIEFMINNGKTSPFHFNWSLPSCVPATIFESSGAVLGVEELDLLFQKFEFVCLSEMMNFPGVIRGSEQVLKKIALASKYGVSVDGHAPGLLGEELVAYASAGISTDHEAADLSEAIEKIALGMKILIRDGSSARNFEELFPLIDQFPDQVMLCCDDIHPEDLLKGHINKIVSRAVGKGLNLFNVLRAATVNPVSHYRLKCGLMQVGDAADFIIVSNLSDFLVQETWLNGVCVFKNGSVLFDNPSIDIVNNFAMNIISVDMLAIANQIGNLKTIEVVDGSLFTKMGNVSATNWGNMVVADTKNDFLKVVVMNRYKKALPVIGIVKGFGLKYGAIASSVAHDSHNVIAVGVSDEDICAAMNAVMTNRGGICTCHHLDIDMLNLPVGGLMSVDSVESVAQSYLNLNERTVNDFGCILSSPFMTLSFLSLLVIPELKIGDQGLFNVNDFRFTDLFS